MENMERLEMLLCDELDKIADEGELTAGGLETIDKLTHSLKSLLTIMTMKGESYDYSYNDNSYRSYARGRSYAPRRMDGGIDRRYSRRGYSRDADIEDRLMDIMDDVKDPKVKQALQKAIEKMEG